MSACLPFRLIWFFCWFMLTILVPSLIKNMNSHVSEFLLQCGKQWYQVGQDFLCSDNTSSNLTTSVLEDASFGHSVSQPVGSTILISFCEIIPEIRHFLASSETRLLIHCIYRYGYFRVGVKFWNLSISFTTCKYIFVINEKCARACQISQNDVWEWPFFAM